MTSSEQKIHHGRGVYPNGSWKSNAIATEHLESHIQYNLDFRPGRALIIDGVCLYRGLGVQQADIDKAIEATKTCPWTKSSAPYQ